MNILSLITFLCFSQTPVITNEKQIKKEVVESMISKSTAIVSINNKINQLNLSTSSLQNQVNELSNSTTSIQNQINQASNIFLPKTGGVIEGNLTVNGVFGVGSYGIWSGGNVTVNGNLNVTGEYLKNGQPVGIGSGGDNLGNHIATTTLDMNGYNIINANFINGSQMELSYNDFQRNDYYRITDIMARPGAFFYSDLYNQDGNVSNTHFSIHGDLAIQSKIIDNNNNLYGYGIYTDIRTEDYSGNFRNLFFLSDRFEIVYKNSDLTKSLVFNFQDPSSIGIIGSPKLEIFSPIIHSLKVGGGGNTVSVYYCNNGTYDGFLTTKPEKCNSGGGTAIQTELTFLQY